MLKAYKVMLSTLQGIQTDGEELHNFVESESLLFIPT